MANAQHPIYLSFPASADLSADQFLFVDMSSTGLAVAGAGTRVVGVLADKPKALAAPGSVQVLGVATVLAGGTIAPGAGIASDASGKAVTATGSAFVVGLSTSAATVTVGQYVECLLVPSGAVGLAAANETVTTGAINPAIPTTYLSITGAQALTLANGSYVGQSKKLEVTVASTSPVGTLTIATANGTEPTVHVFHAVGQILDLVWLTGGWHITSVKRAGQLAVVVGTTVLTGYDLAATYELSVTGTVASTTTKGIPNGNTAGEIIHISTPTAASTPSGSIAITATTIATGVAATSIGGINATTCQADFRWDGATWQSTALTTLTVS